MRLQDADAVAFPTPSALPYSLFQKKFNTILQWACGWFKHGYCVYFSLFISICYRSI